MSDRNDQVTTLPYSELARHGGRDDQHGPQPGQMIAPRIRLVQKLARGGMGEIWCADHLGLQAPVAVKFIAPDLLADDAAVARFELEAKAAAQIASPHVVRHFDHGKAGPMRFIVMEWLEGETLEKRLDDGPLPLREVARIVVQVCSALHDAHEKGVVHRDVKPSNIFITRSGGEDWIKLIDFGLATELMPRKPGQRITSPGAILGTPIYLSPERLRSGERHRGDDLWALAAVAYEALTGVPAFDGDTLGEVVCAILSAEPTPPSTLRRGVNRQLDAWFARALNADREQRFASAAALARAFVRASAMGREGLGDVSARLADAQRRGPRRLARALAATVPGERRRYGMIVGEALHRAGFESVPEELGSFRGFVRRAFLPAAADILGPKAARGLADELLPPVHSGERLAPCLTGGRALGTEAQRENEVLDAAVE